LVVDAVDPSAVETFWTTALGGPAQRALLSFRPQRLPKTVKNRVHLGRLRPRHRTLGATVLANTRHG